MLDQPSQSQTESLVLAAFHRAATRVEAYRNILCEHGVVPDRITDLATFLREVPIMSKETLFKPCTRLSQLCVDGKTDDLSTIYTSSGFSGTYAFGAETTDDETRLGKRLDAVLDRNFQVSSRRTLLINALAAGVRIPARSVTVVDTSTRPDAVVAVMDKVSSDFQQTILVGEHPLIKEVLEVGVDQRFDWTLRPVHVVTGAEVMPENFRDYVGRILGHSNDPTKGDVLVSLGVSELGLSLGVETHVSRFLRKAAHADAGLRSRLFGECPFVPTFVQYDPTETFVECLNNAEGRGMLTVSTLDTSRRIPLIRYTTGDWAQVFDKETIVPFVAEHFRIDEAIGPFIGMWGRGASVQLENRNFYPEQVKEAIYRIQDLPHCITGNFRMTASTVATELALKFQLRRGAAKPPSAPFESSLEHLLGIKTRLLFCSFDEFGSMSYQTKFNYL